MRLIDGNKTTVSGGHLLEFSPPVLLPNANDDSKPPLKAQGVYLTAEGTPALVRVTCGRGVVETSREFHIGVFRSAWISVVGWATVQIEVLSIGNPGPTVGTVGAVLLSEPPQGTPPPLLFLQNIAVAGAVTVPQGAIYVVASIADGGASFSTSVNGVNFPLARPLAVGAQVDVTGQTLTLTVGAPQCLAWFLDPL